MVSTAWFSNKDINMAQADNISHVNVVIASLVLSLSWYRTSARANPASTEEFIALFVVEHHSQKMLVTIHLTEGLQNNNYVRSRDVASNE